MIESPLLPLSPNSNIPPKINPFSEHHYSNCNYYKAVKTLSSVTKKKEKNPFEIEPSYAAERFTAKTKPNFSKWKFVAASKDSWQAPEVWKLSVLLLKAVYQLLYCICSKTQIIGLHCCISLPTLWGKSQALLKWRWEQQWRATRIFC